MGHDIGGMIAFACARSRPDEVARLALIELALPGLGLEQAMNPANEGSFHFGLFMTPEVPQNTRHGRYLVDNGIKWRSLPTDFPPWKRVCALSGAGAATAWSVSSTTACRHPGVG